MYSRKVQQRTTPQQSGPALAIPSGLVRKPHATGSRELDTEEVSIVEPVSRHRRLTAIWLRSRAAKGAAQPSLVRSPRTGLSRSESPRSLTATIETQT
jgi:hypothetical protein